MNNHDPIITARAVLYLRVSTTRQAEHDVSSPTNASREKPTALRAAITLSKLSLRPELPPSSSA